MLKVSRKALVLIASLLFAVSGFTQEVSNLSIKTLLYPGATTKVYSHYMGWFGGKNHINVGYSSTDPAVVAAQVAEMNRRGIDGTIVDWYGDYNTGINNSTKLLKAEAERRKDFTLAICLDVGAVNSRPDKTVSPTDFIIKQINYVKTTYMSSPQYIKTSDGKFLLLEFGMEAVAPDWNKIVAAFPTVAILHRNTSGFTKPGAGAYSWLDSANSSSGYATNFYSVSNKYPTKKTLGSSWAAFDDRLAAWSKNRVVDGRNGQLWLDTFAAIRAAYSATHQLQFVQLVTWNDYEEGSDLEPGIDNGVVLAASQVAGVASVAVTAGNVNAIDHFEASVNGGPFVTVQDQKLDLTQAYDAPGTYTVIFKAVGKPNILNKVSNTASATAKPVLIWQ
jgi:hypothetical protein